MTTETPTLDGRTSGHAAGPVGGAGPQDGSGFWDSRVDPVPVGPALAPLPASGPMAAPAPPAPAVPALGTGPQIRRREVWVPLPDDVQEFYPGYQIKLWANAPRALLAQLAAEPVLPPNATPDQIQAETTRLAAGRLAVLHELVVEHNRWTDYDGREYPPCSDDTFWDGPASIPTDLAVIVVALLAQGGLALPKSLQPRRRPS